MQFTKEKIMTKTGANLEQFVENLILPFGYKKISHKEWDKTQDRTKKYLVTNVPYTSIYETKCRTEFSIINPTRNIRIECKWQQVSGSVDEKFPYMYLNAVHCWPEKEIILLVDGNGYKPKALEWLKQSVINKSYCENTDKCIRVFQMADFMAWVNNNMPQLQNF